MIKVRHFAAAGVFLALSVLAVSGLAVSAKRKTYGRMRWNDNDDRNRVNHYKAGQMSGCLHICPFWGSVCHSDKLLDGGLQDERSM